MYSTKGVFILLFCGCYQMLVAQDSLSASRQKISFNGYIKNLSSYSIDKLGHQNTFGNLVHNRFNVKWKPTGVITFAAELRNRLFWGDQVSRIPDFASRLRNNNEAWNLQKAWVSNNNLVLHTNVERLYVDLKKDKWQARIGRQRINWGMATVWNPNDIYNAYNFLDVDYEERPGSDAVSLQRNLSDFSHVEFVYSSSGYQKQIAAARYFLNRWNYDLQFISGVYHGAATLGLGWAGSIRETGFKGEAQYYFAGKDSASQLNLTLALDHAFKHGWYLTIGGLYNSRGLNRNLNNPGELNLNLSSRNLMPARFSWLLAARKEISPLSTASCTIVYSPQLDLLILSPTISYNISPQWDADLIWQSFFLRYQGSFQGLQDIGYLRFKWSFAGNGKQ